MKPGVIKNELCDRCGQAHNPEKMLDYEYIAFEFDEEVTQTLDGKTTTTTSQYRNATPMKVSLCRSCSAFLRKRHFLLTALVSVGIPFVISLLLFIFHQIELGVIVSMVCIFFLIICIIALKKEIKNKFINPGAFDEDFKYVGAKKAEKLFNKKSTNKFGFLKTKSSGTAVMTPSNFKKLQESSKAVSP